MTALKKAPAHNTETYECIARAIAFIRQHHLDQPDLKTIAEQVHLSEYHFQRLFTEWAGISPKRFMQVLTLEYAKEKIAETQSLLDATVATGLSSPGRLHDLFVTLEAMTPGEFKSGGRGLRIRYGRYPTPFGDCLMATTDRGICHLSFEDTTDQTTAISRLQGTWPHAEFSPEPQALQGICDRLFTPNSADPPLVLHVKGTNFQIQVWQALLRIPFGGITTYQGLGTAIGRPTAARAIGNAVGRNPVGYLIPCHRVIRESGQLGGYRWGVERKATLLGWEAAQALVEDFQEAEPR